MESLKGRVYIVTGGGSGIGRQTCIDLARHHAHVAAVDLRLDTAKETVAIITAQFPEAQVIALECDVVSSEAVKATVAAVVAHFGKLDGAVNGAGIAPAALKHTHDYDESAFALVDNVNLKGVFYSLKYEIEQFLKQSQGDQKASHYAVVNVSSVAGLVGAAGCAYAASKHGVLGLTKTAALEYATRGIRVNAVCPGAVDTPMLTESFKKQNVDPAVLLANVPVRRFAAPSEISSVITWLLSDAASYITGVGLPVDGGYTCR